MANLSIAGILYKDQKILLGKRKPGGHVGGLWEFPGGKIENNETGEEALIREFKEELDIDVKVLSKICKKEFKSETKNFTLIAYYIDALSYDIIKHEHSEIKWFTINEIFNLKELVDSDKLLLNDIKDFFSKKDTII